MAKFIDENRLSELWAKVKELFSHAGDMLSSTYDPQGKAQDVFGYAEEQGEAAKDAAALDATTKANAAKSDAISTAATDATQKANQAETNAKAASRPVGWMPTARDVGALALTGGTVTGDIDAVNNKISARCVSVNALNSDEVGEILVGTTISMEYNPLVGISTPTDPDDAANKQYVDNTTGQKAELLHAHGEISSDGAIGNGTPGLFLLTGIGGFIRTMDASGARSTLGVLSAEMFTGKTVAVSAWVGSSTYSAQGYNFRASVACAGVTASHRPDVAFGAADAVGGNFAPVADSYAGGVYIYAKVKPTATVTIPSIVCVKGV